MDNPSILVVDDELLIRDLLYDFFSGQGWQISVADNAGKALEILRDKKIDLVLTDIKMPEMDGLDLAGRVQADYPQIPVVLMTGYPSVDSAVQALRARVADYIVKPFNINQLYKTIEQKLSERDTG
ncbi:MAG: response regulator [Candidatus Zixiibacteriota bacterium]|nr:MAG: response regulator [candidate division Zixibacteria bacterium]